MRRPLAALAALSVVPVLCATGCDPVGQARFAVVDKSGAVVAGASVVVVCPKRATPLREQSDPDGKVVVEIIPDIDSACMFTIEKTGFVTRTVGRADVGYHKGIDDKAPLVKVVLDRAP
jgi:hypothetical protein